MIHNPWALNPTLVPYPVRKSTAPLACLCAAEEEALAGIKA